MNAIRTIITIGSVIVLTGCGASASAPPIDLPAPVVGRIAVSTPDTTGKATVTGSEQAVTGGEMVLAINERLEATTALWKVTDILIPFAYAQVIPNVCNEPGHWCTKAASDGSFELTVDAVIGDSIVLVLIDQDGSERSPRVSIIVPSTNLALNGCDGQGVNGSMTDLFNAEGVGISLYEGNDVSNNKVIFGATTVALPGCYAQDVVFITGGADEETVVALSENDNIIWIGTYTGGFFTSAQTVVLDDTPLALADIGQTDFLAIALRSSSGLFVGRLSLTDGTIDNLVKLPDPTQSSHVLDGVIRMIRIGPFTDGGYLLGLLMTGTDTNETIHFVHFVETTGFTIATEMGEPINLFKVLSMPEIDMVDAALSVGAVSSTNVMMLFLDAAANSLWAMELHLPGLPVELAGSTAASLSNAVNVLSPLRNDMPVQGPIPKRIDVGISQGAIMQAPVAYVLIEDATNTYNLWTLPDFAGIPPQPNFLSLIDAANKPVVISVSTPVEGIMVGDEISNAVVNADSFWYDDF